MKDELKAMDDASMSAIEKMGGGGGLEKKKKTRIRIGMGQLRMDQND